VLPGLVDLHVHLPPPIALGERQLFSLLFLAHGVTSVRDTGSFIGDPVALADEIRRGERVGPRLFACGPFLDGDPPIWPNARVVRTPADADAAIADFVEAGRNCAKLYNNLSRDTVAALRESAGRRGLRVIAHVPDSVALPDLGGTEVQHFMRVTEDWGALDPDVLEFIARISVAREIEHTPTLVAFTRASRLERYDERQADPDAALLPRYYRELLWNPARNPRVYDLLPGDGSTVQERVVQMKRLARRLHAAEVPIHVGTDTPNPFVVPGASLHEELALLVEAGLPLDAVWLAATRSAGRALGVPQLGTLEVGAPADLLVFREDPTRDLAALATLEAVIADGRLYRKRDLDAAIARQLAHLEGFPYEAVTMAAARVVLFWLNR
jgi:imidazolonepropionase-like amidohydrolase